MKSVFSKKSTPDPQLLHLKAELLAAQNNLSQAYRRFDQAVDPDLVDACIYEINALTARCNYLLRSMKERSPEAASPRNRCRTEEPRAQHAAPDCPGEPLPAFRHVSAESPSREDGKGDIAWT